MNKTIISIMAIALIFGSAFASAAVSKSNSTRTLGVSAAPSKVDSKLGSRVSPCTQATGTGVHRSVTHGSSSSVGVSDGTSTSHAQSESTGTSTSTSYGTTQSTSKSTSDSVSTGTSVGKTYSVSEGKSCSTSGFVYGAFVDYDLRHLNDGEYLLKVDGKNKAKAVRKGDVITITENGKVVTKISYSKTFKKAKSTGKCISHGNEHSCSK